MDHPGRPLTDRDAMLAHWLKLVPEHQQFCARFGVWSRANDQLEERLGRYGAGRN